MDFGISFLSNNLMLPILDFFYGIVPSYGLAIVALTLVIRFALYPLNAGSLRNMRRMKVAQPLMKERVDQIQKLYKENPAKQQEEMSKVYKEFGNPLAGCFPLLLQMPVLFALFATLRGSPFSDINYSVNVQVLPKEQIENVQPQAFATPPQNIYVTGTIHAPLVGVIPGGDKLAVGDTTKIDFQTPEGKPLKALAAENKSEIDFEPRWKVIKGEEIVKVDEQGNITALAPGEATVQGTVPGLATNKGFLFIEALGRVGAIDSDGTIHWDILVMILGFGISLYINQTLSGQAQGPNDNPQQATVNKLTPVIFSGMFLFFPLPAGVLMYMLIANIFQTVQAFILSREPLPENLQKIVDEAEAKTKKDQGLDAMPFEPKRAKKKA
ncbi:membrane protein insertase YidC [Microcoleus sp. C2C3]|uniref:membrane protein insertase YidC n=1 Tax=unclassified Microcoleus TaxID=2642155 RepID=UPI002FCE7976